MDMETFLFRLSKDGDGEGAGSLLDVGDRRHTLEVSPGMVGTGPGKEPCDGRGCEDCEGCEE